MVKIAESDLDRFAAAGTLPDERSRLLTALIAAKVVPRDAEEPRFLAGRKLLLQQTLESDQSSLRLLGISEAVRLSQVVKRWSKELYDYIEPLFVAELPPIRLLVDPDQRLNLARACRAFRRPWMPAYLAKSVAEEEAGEKTRDVLLEALLSHAPSLSEVLGLLGASFAELQPQTEDPRETVARRLTRVLESLKLALGTAEPPLGRECGRALAQLVGKAISGGGRFQKEKTSLELSSAVLAFLHQIARSYLSAAADPETYRVVQTLRAIRSSSSWPSPLREDLARIIGDVSEALLLLGRQGLCEQGLYAQLELLFDYPEIARSVAKALAEKNAELPEDVRYWLVNGRLRTTRKVSDSALEAAAANADQGIGLALHEGRRARLLQESLEAPVLGCLEVYEPMLATAAQDLFARIQALAIVLEQVASQRSIGVLGSAGEEVDVATKYFDVVGDQPRQRMTVRVPAIVRLKADGRSAEVLVKGIVE